MELCSYPRPEELGKPEPRCREDVGRAPGRSGVPGEGNSHTTVTSAPPSARSCQCAPWANPSRKPRVREPVATGLSVNLLGAQCPVGEGGAGPREQMQGSQHRVCDEMWLLMKVESGLSVRLSFFFLWQARSFNSVTVQEAAKCCWK